MSSGDELGRTATTGGAAGRPSGAPPMAGDTIGRYVIERVLGAGGMGVVYAAHDPDLDRRVALKLLHAAGTPGTGTGDEARARLLREARAMAKVNHPNVITVYEVGTAGGVDFVAMELIDGTNLADWLRGAKRPPQPEVLRAFFAAGRGLSAAHAMGLVHRDFKPANVLLARSGKVVVTDFGLARVASPERDSSSSSRSALAGESGAASISAVTAPGTAAAAAAANAPTADGRKPPVVNALDETMEAAETPAPTASTSRTVRSGSADMSSTITRTGAVLGTPAYMAPEQFAGAVAGPKADQYAFSVALWEGLAGARPFRGASFEELKQSVETGEAADADRIPRRLRSIIERGMARDAAARWPDLDALLTALDRAERRPRQLAFAALGLVALAAIAAFVMFGPKRQGAVRHAAVACSITDADLAEAWSPEISARLGKRFGQEWTNQLSAVDHFADTWRAERARTCAEPTAREYHGRVACLLAGRDELGAILSMAENVPPEAIRGASIAEILSDPESCRSGVQVARPRVPDDPAVRAALSAIQRDVTTATLGARMGNSPAARQLIDAALERARASSEPLSLALALQGKGTVEHILGNCEKAEAFYADAAIAAESASAGGMRAMSKIGQLECFMGRSSDIEAVRAVARQAEAAVAGAGGDNHLKAVLAMNLSRIDAMAGDYDHAIERVAEARTIFIEARDGRRSAVSAATEADLRDQRNAPGDTARSLELTREALTHSETMFGREHRLTRGNRALLASRLLAREPETARAMFTELAKTRPPPAPDDRPPNSDGRAWGVVVGPDGAPVAGAEVWAGPLILAGDDGLPLPMDMGEAQAQVAFTDAQGRFDMKVATDSTVMAWKGDLRALGHIAVKAITLKLGPAISASGTVTVMPVAAPPGSERAAQLAAHFTHADAVIIGTGDIAGYAAIARHDASGAWSVRGLPPDPRLVAGAALNTGLGDRTLITKPVVGVTGPIALTLDVRGAAIDVIVRADRAASIPTAEVIVIPGKLAKMPRTGVELRNAVGKVPGWSGAVAAPVVDTTHTQAGDSLYKPGDIHSRFAGFPPGPATACVLPFAGDVRDVAFMRTLWSAELEVSCRVLDIAASPPVQAFVVETPPMKRIP